MKRLFILLGLFGWFTVASNGAVVSEYKFQEGVWNGTDSSAGSYNVEDNVTGFFDVDSINNGSVLVAKRPESSPIVSNFRFDLTAAAGDQGLINRASLRVVIELVEESVQIGPGTLNFYALPGGNTNWSEATASYSEQDEVTAGNDPWKLNTGSDASDNLAAAQSGTLIGQAVTSSAPAPGEVVTIDLDTDVINEWLLNPSSYAGFTMMLQNNGGNGPVRFRLHSSEAATSADRPLLNLQYVIPEPSTSAMFIMGSVLLFAMRRIRA